MAPVKVGSSTINKHKKKKTETQEEKERESKLAGWPCRRAGGGRQRGRDSNSEERISHWGL